jgi:hypothetical protein
MDNQLQNSLCYPDPQVDFKPANRLKTTEWKQAGYSREQSI